jgi:heme exporter protein A
MSGDPLFNLALSVRQLSCRRGGRLVLSDVAFSLEAGGALLIQGPNGVGKSTLLRALGGLIGLETGSVSLGPHTAEQRSVDLPEASHLVGHQDAVKPNLTLAENIQAWIGMLAIRPSPSPKRVSLALAALGLEGLAHRPARFLSQGQRRRLSLARLVAVPRALWLLDEPTLGLDQAAQLSLDRLIQAHRDQGGMVIATSHQPLAMPGAQVLTFGRPSPMAATQ